MRRRGITLIEFLIERILIPGILLLILYPVFQRARGTARRAECQSHLKQIGLAFLQYAQDYDGCLPSVASTNPIYGWADALLPYSKSTALYHCPLTTSNSSQTNPKQRGYNDYWMNAFGAEASSMNINGQNVVFDKVTVGLPMRTILVGEGNDGRDATTARYSLSQLPPAWLKNADSPAYRHFDAMNLLFVDGHVQVLKPKRIVASPHSGPSFALK